MKRINILLFFIAVCVYIVMAKPPIPDNTQTQTCYANETSHSFNNIHAYGDMLINTQSLYSLSEFLNIGCVINVTVKATKGCSYTWNKSYVNSDSKIIGNTVQGIMIPQIPDYSITVKVESPCIFDTFLSRNVKLVWTKTTNSLENSSSTELGYPIKVDCASTRTSEGRNVVVRDYVASERVASSSSRSSTSRTAQEAVR